MHQREPGDIDITGGKANSLQSGFELNSADFGEDLRFCGLLEAEKLIEQAGWRRNWNSKRGWH